MRSNWIRQYSDRELANSAINMKRKERCVCDDLNYFHRLINFLPAYTRALQRPP